MNNLIYLGLTIIPFAALLGFDSREPRLILSTLFCLALGYKANLKHCSFIILVFIAYILFSVWQAPVPTFIFNGLNIGNFYVWEPLVIILIYSLAFVRLSTEKIDSVKILTIMINVGTVVAIHGILQSLGLAQWTDGTSTDLTGLVQNKAIYASLLAMVTPLCLKQRKLPQMAIIAIAVLLTLTQVPIFAMFFGCMVTIGLKRKNMLILTTCLFISIISLSIFDVCVNDSADRFIFKDSYRLKNWSRIVDECVSPINGKKYTLTGRGIGSFRYMYHMKDPKDGKMYGYYLEAHSEYLQVLYELGIFGLILFLLLIYTLTIKNKQYKDKAELYGSLTAVILMSGAMFPLRIASTAFYTLILLSLLNNREVHDGISSEHM